VERCRDDNRREIGMRRLMLAAMLGLGMLSGAASAAPVGPGLSAAGSTLLMPVQYHRHYAPPPRVYVPRRYGPPPRAYGRRYYGPPPRAYGGRHYPPPARYAPPRAYRY
jgi:hypothetical protein